MMVSFLLGKQNFSFIIEGRTGEKQWGCPLSAYRCYPSWAEKRVLKIDGAGASRVLGFDSHYVAEGCGIAAFGGDEYKDSVTGFPTGHLPTVC